MMLPELEGLGISYDRANELLAILNSMINHPHKPVHVIAELEKRTDCSTIEKMVLMYQLGHTHCELIADRDRPVRVLIPRLGLS